MKTSKSLLKSSARSLSGRVSWGLSDKMPTANNAKGKRVEDDEPELICPRFVRREGNHIYLYDVLDSETQLMCINLLRMAVRDIMTEHVGEIINGELTDAVTLHINSPGGWATAGFALYDFIKASQFPIVGVVEGECCSAATLPFLACKTRAMGPNSIVLLHQLSWGDYGKDMYMQDQAVNCQYIMKRLRKIYLDETTIGAHLSDEKAREEYLQGLLEHDLYLDIDDCQRYGILTESEDDLQLSEERAHKLESYIEKLFEEQKAEDEKLRKAAKTVAGKTVKTPAKKKPARTTKKTVKPVKKPVKKATTKKPKKTATKK